MTEIITRGELHTGADFEKAAAIFQHGHNTNDYLFAHTLAVIAISKGRSQARWLAAATLDRYLHSTHQPQIYGTESLGTPPQDRITGLRIRTIVLSFLIPYGLTCAFRISPSSNALFSV